MARKKLGGKCRFLSDTDYCAYWDMQLQDRETIRCEGPGGWSEDCWTEDTRGAIFDPATNKFYTMYDYAALLEARVPGEITDTEQDRMREHVSLDPDTIVWLLTDRNAPKGRE